MRIALFPKSLVARVYALYALTLLVFVGAGLGIFYKFQFSQHIEEAQESATTVVDVTAQTISDSAVIGDFDSIQRMLKKAVTHTQFDSASFIDASGSPISCMAWNPDGDRLLIGNEAGAVHFADFRG